MNILTIKMKRRVIDIISHFVIYWICWVLMILPSAAIGSSSDQTPSLAFVRQPPQYVYFSNATGAHVDCLATGNPITPLVTWILSDGSPVTDVERLRYIMPNGTLVFAAFRAPDYRVDVHASAYKCVASNSIGSIVSRNVFIRAVVMQHYEVQVYDEFVINGNTAVLKCHVPSFISDFVTITSWMKEINYHSAKPIQSDDKYTFLSTGKLHIHDIGNDDSLPTFRCQTTHRLTGEKKLSSTSGRLVVTEAKGSVPPRITDMEPTLYSKEGTTVIVPCAAQGHPAPQYRWTSRNNGDIVLSKSNGLKYHLIGGNLIIHNVRKEDSGIYECTANNSVGAEKTETTLTITAPLSTVVQPKFQIVDISRSASMTCITSGYPITSIIWLKDGQRIRGRSSEMTASIEGTLTLNSIRKEDMGLYQCFVSNEWETVEATSELQLGDSLPSFLETFPERTIHPGPQVSLRCSSSGAPLPKIMWYLDQIPVPNEDVRLRTGQYIDDMGNVVGVLNISNVRVEDGGQYKCLSENRVGQIESSAMLNIYGPTVIRSLPPLSVVAGRNLTFRCPVSGYPVESIRWQKDGKVIPLNKRQVVFPNGTLHIRTIQRNTDVGKYTCLVRTKEGLNVQRDFEIQVLVPPKIVPFSFPDNGFLQEGIRVQLFCAVSDGDLPIDIDWLKNGQSLPSDSKMSTNYLDKYASTLVIAQVAARHTGNYTCVARNGAATVTHTSRLVVQVPPQWVLEPKDVSIGVGKRLSLDCKADGFPIPAVTWLRAVDNLPGEYQEIHDTIDNGARISHLRNGTLIINDIIEKDEGKYLCQATNGIGTGLSIVIFVDIQVPARFHEWLSNVTAKRSSVATLQCRATGDLPMDVFWSVNGKKLTTGNNPRFNIIEFPSQSGMMSKLILNPVEGTDSTIYTCTASNFYGQDETRFILSVQERPEPPMGVNAVEQSSRTAHVSWLKPHDGNSEMAHYIVQFKRATGAWLEASTNVTVPGTETSVVVQSLQPATSYHIRVFAVNDMGNSDPSEAVIITTTEEAPSGPPQDIQTKVVNSETVQITWKPPKKDLWNGVIRGYHVGYRISDSSEPLVFNSVENYNSGGNVHSIELSGLKKFTKYMVVVQAFNHVGSGPKSEEIEVSTAEDVPSKPPSDVKCSQLSSQSLHVSWEPPPTNTVNGQLQGHKVVYKPVQEEWYDARQLEAKITPASKTILHGLQKNINYSIEVSAYNRAGDSERSVPVFCRTLEDVPDAPGDVKAVISSQDSILLTWKEPLNSNGNILKYMVYVRSADHGKEDTVKHIVLDVTQFEVVKLKRNIRYDFWITAATSIGEGQSTRVTSQTITSPLVPAKVISFDSEVVIPFKTDVVLPCKTVGKPTPDRTWKSDDRIIEQSDRFHIDKYGNFRITSVRISDAGIYTCIVQNNYGSDEVKYRLIVQVPPSPPILGVISTTHTSIVLNWKLGLEGGENVRGYIIYYKRDYGEWETSRIKPYETTFTLENLECGTRYQLYMSAFNKIGIGSPSEAIFTKTKGSSPEGPPKYKLVRANSTFVTLRLEAWSDGGCAILHFVVEYKLQDDVRWRLVANNVHPGQTQFVIPDLRPATWYKLKVTAHNSAGSTTLEYDFGTHTLGGDVLLPILMQNEENLANDKLYLYSWSLLAFIGAVLAVGVMAIVLVCICTRRRHNTEGQKISEAEGMPVDVQTVELKPLQDQQFQKNLAMGSFTCLLRGSENGQLRHMNTMKHYPQDYEQEQVFSDDVNPYATSQISSYHKNEHRNLVLFPHRFFAPDLPPRNQQNESATYSKVIKRCPQNYHCDQPEIEASAFQRQDAFGSQSPREEDICTSMTGLSDSLPTLYALCPTAPIYGDSCVPDILEHEQELSSSNSSLESRRMTLPKYITCNRTETRSKPNWSPGINQYT